jgi:hypothetical protein
MSAQLLGIVVFKVDGQVLRSEPGASLDFGGYERAPVPGARPDDAGFSESSKVAMADCVVMFDASTRLSPMKIWRDLTVVFEADTGQVYVLNHAWLQNTPKVTSGQGGKLPLTFCAATAQEA